MKNENKTGRARDTGMAATLIVLLVAYFGHREFLIIPAVVLLLLAMALPKVFSPLAPVWFGLSRLLGGIVSRVFFSTIFLLIATPMGVIRQLAGKDSMRLKPWKKSSSSVFVERNLTYTAKNLEKPY